MLYSMLDACTDVKMPAAFDERVRIVHKRVPVLMLRRSFLILYRSRSLSLIGSCVLAVLVSFLSRRLCAAFWFGPLSNLAPQGTTGTRDRIHD
jgi:hypothetical protein